MASPVISLDHLSKTYRVPVRPAGLAASLKSLFRRKYDEVPAVRDISFRIEAGEIVGLIGPNGAGKTTTLKVLTGLLHRPSVMFLDEPTLGLDVSMQLRLRRFLAEYNRQSGVTVLLTSHYMADVEALCPRVILIHRGQILYDGALADLSLKLAPFKLLRLTLAREEGQAEQNIPLPQGVHVMAQEGNQLSLRVARLEAPALTAHLLQTLPIVDLTVEDPPIEDVIDQIYTEGGV